MEDEVWEGTRAIIGWGVAIGAVCLLIAFIWAAASGALQDLRTRGTRNSIEYISSRNQHARDLIIVYLGTGTDGQRQAILNDICSATSELKLENVDRDVQTFLEQHPCGGAK